MKIFVSATSSLIVVLNKYRKYYSLNQKLFEPSKIEKIFSKLNVMTSIIEWKMLRFPCKDRIVDSGVFEIIREGGLSERKVWELLDIYIDVIKELNIEKFVEMDLDLFFPYKKILEFRSYLERKTGEQPILVYHNPRGIENFEAECKDYKYHGLSIPHKKFIPSDKIIFRFLDIAKKYNTKVHGFGALCFQKMLTFPFDSVDGSLFTFLLRYRQLMGITKNGRLKSIKFNQRALFPQKVDTQSFEFFVASLNKVIETIERMEKELIPS